MAKLKVQEYVVFEDIKHVDEMAKNFGLQENCKLLWGILNGEIFRKQ